MKEVSLDTLPGPPPAHHVGIYDSNRPQPASAVVPAAQVRTSAHVSIRLQRLQHGAHPLRMLAYADPKPASTVPAAREQQQQLKDHPAASGARALCAQRTERMNSLLHTYADVC